MYIISSNNICREDTVCDAETRGRFKSSGKIMRTIPGPIRLNDYEYIIEEQRMRNWHRK